MPSADQKELQAFVHGIHGKHGRKTKTWKIYHHPLVLAYGMFFRGKLVLKNLDTKDLEAVTRRIVDAIHPEKIILFGSHVWGEPTEESDVDFLVVVKNSEQPGYRRARDIYHSLRGIRLPVEVLVRTCDELERGSRLKNSLERKILEEGRVLHG